MNMNHAVIVGGDHIRRKQEAAADILADLARHIVTECAVDDRVLVGVLLLGFLVVTFEYRSEGL